MADAYSTSPISLLSPPNPAMSLEQPQGSILINRNDPTCINPKQQAALNSASKSNRVASAIKQSFALKDVAGGTRQAAPPAAVYNGRGRTASVSSSASTSSSVSSQNHGMKRSNSVRHPSVSFAPLPAAPTLERRRSIALGVAARSNMLKTQGGAAGKMGGSGVPGGRVLMMNDEEWEEYKKNIAQRNQSQEVPELHHLVRDSTKKLWKKARSMSNSSNASSTSSRDPSASGSTRARSESNSSMRGLPQPQETISLPPTGERDQSPSLAPPPFGRTNSGGRIRNGLISRIKGTKPEVPENAISDDYSDVASDIGSIPEEFEYELARSPSLESDVILEEPEEEEEDYEYADGTLTPDDRERIRQEEEEEMQDQGEVPAYLRRDISAERNHYRDVHEGITTPRGRKPSADHVVLADRLRELGLHRNEELSGEGDGEQTPGARRSPKLEAGLQSS